MIIKTSQALEKTERMVVTKDWKSLRLLLKSDNMGFSFHLTTIFAGARLNMQYLNHLESVYCISGEGMLETEDGTIHPITPGTLYALDQHDKHVLSATTELTLACVFNPPLNGRETHDETGSYPLAFAEVASA